MISQRFFSAAPHFVSRQAFHARKVSRQLSHRRAVWLCKQPARPICCRVKDGLSSNKACSNSGGYAKSRKSIGNQVFRYYSDKALPSHQKVILPNLSPTMESGTVVSWEKEEGDKINEGEVLAMIETDKATMEMETPEEGYLAKILVPAGTKDVAVTQVICIIVEEEGDVAAFSDFTLQETATKQEAPREAEKTSEQKDVPFQESKPAEPVAEKPAEVKQDKLAEPFSTGRIIASPMAKKEAAQLGINLEDIKGTGPSGRITSSDVANTAAMLKSQPQVVQPTPVTSYTQTATTAGEYTDIELSSMRKTIAKRLLEAKQTIPHYYLSVDVEMDDVLRLRKELNEIGKKDEFKISVNDFIIKAASLALKKVPECNSSWMGDFVRKYHNVDVSVAVSTEGGLITPIVFDSDKKGLAEISDTVRSLAEKARNKLLQPNEFMGGTFTLSNLGMFGIKNFSAVINPPQSCILAIGSTEKKLLPDENSETSFRTASIMSVTLSCDHRVVDGAVGAQWLQHFKKYLQQPTTMLL